MPRSHHGPPIDDLVRDACRGSAEPFRDLLLRRGGLPGPRPNFKLALAAATALVAQGSAGRKLIDELRSLDAHAAPVGSAHPILPMVGVLALGWAAAKTHAQDERAALLRSLQQHVDDPRREVRDAIAVAIGMPLREHPATTLRELFSWTDGYLHAELVLRAVSESEVLQKLDDAGLLLSVLQQAFALAADAPRAHQRSQGYRTLMRTMTVAVVAVGRRFPHPVVEWIEEHAEVAPKDLLAVLNDVLDGLRSAGLRAGEAESVHDALEAAIPPPRDPRWDVGPTRGRGKKARKKGRR